MNNGELLQLTYYQYFKWRHQYKLIITEYLMDNHLTNKADFLESEIWILTIGGAFQRANVYQDTADEKVRGSFRSELHEQLKSIAEKYRTEASGEEHIVNIENLSNFSKKFENILKGGQLNFGVSQKLLNLYLKYQWCLDKIPTPPHFPVDRVIQQALKIDITPWTQMQGKEDYKRIIGLAKEALKKEAYKQFNSIAELELYLFSRRNEK
ncbi:MAG: hypothetical protein ACKVTZ_10665 [Bacteroidia bacterium]